MRNVHAQSEDVVTSPTIRVAKERRRERRRGQAFVEMALVLPVFLSVVVGCVDVGRYVYIRSTLTHNARDIARLAAMVDNQSTDCAALASGKFGGGGFTITQDPASVAGDTGSDYGTPTAGSGYVYIYPAAATSTSTCTGGARTGFGACKSVTVRITYVFQPLTPGISKIVSAPTVTIGSSQPVTY